MILKQYYLGCLSQASYLIGDEATKTAVVVDPRRDVEEYLEDAAEAGLRIAHVILTHFHADFVAGHLELRERTGARIHLGARATAEYEFSPLADGDVLELGQVRLQIIETPGHTPEAISVLVFDLAKDRERPQAVLTGDTLFIGDVGRPDLMASVGISARRAGRPALRLGPSPAPAPRRHARLSRARGGLGLRQEPQLGDGVDDRRSAARELLAAADEPGGLRDAGHHRPAQGAVVLRLRRPAQPARAVHLGGGARPRAGRAPARRRAPRAARRRADPRRARPGRLRGGPPRRQHQRQPEEPLRVVGGGAAHAGAAHRDRGRAGQRARGGRAARPHRLRQRAGLSRGGHRRRAEPAGGRPARAAASPAPSWRASCARGR